ncbi:MAG: DUF1361 domain-containing protein [Snowella sp.]|nr:DUF1361 domain-containing protein [Snowella sp.]
MNLILSWLEVSFLVLSLGLARILWNLFLAYIPLVLSVWLFRWSHRRSPLWWILLAVFIAFLPNAPYILTDLIHYVKTIQRGIPESIIILALTPQYIVFIVGGFQAYVMSLLNVEFYLQKMGWEKWSVLTQLILHFLSAIGIYLGRFLRFNSWDFLAQPDELAQSLAQDLSHKQPILAISVTFLILTALYWFTKQINLGLVLRFQEIQQQRRKNRFNQS